MPRPLSVRITPEQAQALRAALVAAKQKPRQHAPQSIRNLAILVSVAEGRSLEEAAAHMVSKQYVSRLVRLLHARGVGAIAAPQRRGRRSRVSEVAALLKRGTNDRAAAAQLGVSHATVARARRLLAAESVPASGSRADNVTVAKAVEHHGA